MSTEPARPEDADPYLLPSPGTPGEGGGEGGPKCLSIS